MGSEPDERSEEVSETAVTFPVIREDQFLPPALLREVGDSAQPRRLRFPDGHVGWLVSDYANARAVLADRRFIVGVIRQASGQPGKYEAYDEALGALRAGAITSTDPPAHTRLRRAVGKRFSPAGIEELSGRVERIVRDQLGAIGRAGSPLDLFADFGLPIPSRVICDLLGVPESDEHQFVEPTELLLSQNATPEQVREAFSAFTDYVRAVVEQKRVRPEDDLLSDLLRAEVLTDDEIAGVALELFVTGHETSAGLIAMSVLALLEERSRWELLCRQPELMDSAVEELLRYLSVVDIGFVRTAVEDATIGAVPIAAGESVAISLLAANHDPARFDRSEIIDPRRPDNGHLAFGHGLHKCLGQHLARLELRVALTGLMRELPTLRLAVPPSEVPLESTDAGVYRVSALPVSW
jgi:cytochrome P450